MLTAELSGDEYLFEIYPWSPMGVDKLSLRVAAVHVVQLCKSLIVFLVA